MPSFEILVESPGGDIELAEYSFALEAESPPVSHRDPSHWQARFEELGGPLFHLGSPNLKQRSVDEGPYFAYELLDHRYGVDDEIVHFKRRALRDIVRLLEKLLLLSKVKRVHITSDWQICSSCPYIYSTPFSLTEFVKLHDDGKLRFNSWLTITA